MMDQNKLNKILKEHKLWLSSERKRGKRANLINADLSNVDLTNANLSNACLINANLTNVNLTNANLIDANLIDADLTNADLTNANLTNANLTSAEFRWSTLKNANFKNTKLEGAYFFGSDLTGADFTGANLKDAYLTNAIMDNCKGLIDPIEYLDKTFKKTELGYIVYKTFNSQFEAPQTWKIEEKSEIIENDINIDRRESCGPGINVATKEWVISQFGRAEIWKCLIKFEDANDPMNTVVPYATDGKIRCRKLTILEREK